MGGRRRSRVWAVAASGALVTAGVIGVAPPVAAQAAGPALTVTPGTGLADGAEVAWAASGLEPGDFVSIVQCAAGTATSVDENCDILDSSYDEASDDGTVTGTHRVDAVLTTGFQGGSLDCRPAGACVLALAFEGSEIVATAPLAFAPGAPLAPAPTATVTPAQGLTDLQQVEVAGSGFVWSHYAVILVCASGVVGTGDTERCDWGTESSVAVEDGNLSFELEAPAVLDTSSGEPVDCREPGACELLVTQDFALSATKSAVVPLAFDPDAEVVLPTITVEPDHDLADGDTVMIHGEGFRPGSFVDVALCAAPVGEAACSSLNAWSDVAEDGTVMTEAVVWPILSEGGAEVDCRTAAEPCVLVLSSGPPTSLRAGRAPLHFDPDAPVAPAPELELSQSTDLPDDATVTVTGTHFPPGGFVWLEVCAAESRCDENLSEPIDVQADGTFTLDLALSSTLATWDGETVDCRAETCSIVANDLTRGRTVTVPLAFAPEAPPVHRYLDPVFDEVTVTEDVVYREVTDASGNPVQLTLDVYEPAGDTLAERPAVVWLDDGWFTGEGPFALAAGDGMADYAEAFAKRGYVAVTMSYRPQPGVACCPGRDALGITQALVDTHDDATHGIAWLREHAADYGIDPEAIAAGGADAGAVAAYGLAYRPHESHHAGPADVAAALPISGMSLGKPTDEGAPVLAFHGGDDFLAPLHLSEWTCADAERMGVTCETVSYPGMGGGIAATRQRDIVSRSAAFLATNVLEPLGYIQPDPPDTSNPTTPGTAPVVDPGTSPGTGTVTPGGTSGSGTGSGSLPKTGSDALPLAGLGVVLAAVGATLIAAAGLRRRGLALVPARIAAAVRRRPPGDDGRGTLPVAVVVAVIGLVLGVLAAPGATLARQEGPTTSPSAPTTVTVIPDEEGPTTTMPGDEGHDHETTTTVGGPAASSTTVSVPAPATTTTMGDHDHEHPTTSTTAGEDPHHEFPDDWTPEQVAFAEQLIADTEAALPRFANPAILPLLGYTWITDGTEIDTYQHWINTGLIASSETLNPEQPESLVFRNTHDGPVLEAAMYMLSVGYTMDNIPADIAWLPDWHVHTNLCFDSQFRVIGLTVNGVCERGTNFVTPPMLHVWTVDTPCGRFAGVDENGLQCHHEH